MEMQALCFALNSWCPMIPNCPGMCSDLFPTGKVVLNSACLRSLSADMPKEQAWFPPQSA